jgi:hypothetical protein
MVQIHPYYFGYKTAETQQRYITERYLTERYVSKTVQYTNGTIITDRYKTHSFSKR